MRWAIAVVAAFVGVCNRAVRRAAVLMVPATPEQRMGEQEGGHQCCGECFHGVTLLKLIIPFIDRNVNQTCGKASLEKSQISVLRQRGPNRPAVRHRRHALDAGQRRDSPPV